VAGLLIAPAALLMLGWALVVYRARTAAILRREAARYDDQRGPAVATALLLLLLGLAYGFALRAVVGGGGGG
jgi:hypothetical protein